MAFYAIIFPNFLRRSYVRNTTIKSEFIMEMV